MQEALPTVLIGGYLGAGKTTLVNHLLQHAEGRRIAVLVNDFGDISIDADLIEGADGGVLSLAGGCLCCSFGDDLVGTLIALTRRAPRPDAVLIELSGVALPAAVARTVRLAPGIEQVGTLVVADAAELQRQAGDRYVGDTVRQQLHDADWLLLNKPDQVDAPTLQATAAWLAQQAPQARRMCCAATELPAPLVLGWRRHDIPRASAGAEGPFSARRRAPTQHTAPSPFASLCRGLPADVDLRALGSTLAADGNVLRAKALARDARGEGWLLQVAARRWAVTPATVDGDARLVVIGLRGRLASWLLK